MRCRGMAYRSVQVWLGAPKNRIANYIISIVPSPQLGHTVPGLFPDI